MPMEPKMMTEKKDHHLTPLHRKKKMKQIFMPSLKLVWQPMMEAVKHHQAVMDRTGDMTILKQGLIWLTGIGILRQLQGLYPVVRMTNLR